MNQKGFINIAVVIGVIILALVGAGAYFVSTGQVTLPTPTPTACTREAKQCPDGSYVTRTGKNCEFAECPAINPTPTPTPKPNSTSYNKDGTCPSGYVNYGIPLQCVTPEYMEYCQTNSCPICLAGNTSIETPMGLVLVKDLRIGMSVWTTDISGRRVSGVVQKTSRVPVSPTHQMAHLVLDDGRELFASPGHPTVDGRTVGDLVSGDLYNGARVVAATRNEYDEGATYDILPSGETGFYFANGVLLGSTLH